MATADAGAEFGKQYLESLQELTFNSRPIIESHTLLAQENTIYAGEIVAAIERRIERAIPSQKLFALYLMDSIAKNVGLPYTTLFSKSLLKTFTTAYSLVDDPTRVRMIKLFKTWKVPTAFTGLPLFDSRQLDQIEQFLIKATAGNVANPISSTGSTPSRLGTPPTPQSLPLNGFQTGPSNEDPQWALVRDIEDLTNMVNSRLIASPNDDKALQRFNLLNQLKGILSADASLPPQQLDSVRQQLLSIRNDEAMKLNALRQSLQKAKSLSPPLLQTAVNNNLNTANAQALFSIMSSVASQKSPHAQHQNQQPPASLNSILGETSPNDGTGSFRGTLGLNNLSFLQNILSKSGAKATPPSQNQTTSGAPIDFGFIQPSREQLVSQFALTETFITHHRPSNYEAELLYPRDSTQCSNCPKRFPATQLGQIEKQAHLDWHFRINKRVLSTSGGGVVNRSWYLTSDEWINFDPNGVTGSNGNNAPHNGGGASTTGPSLGAVSFAEHGTGNDFREDRSAAGETETPFVAIPPGASNEVTCDVCKEIISGVFDEDTGEWIWRGAVSYRGKVRHYMCHLETTKRDRSPQRPQP